MYLQNAVVCILMFILIRKHKAEVMGNYSAFIVYSFSCLLVFVNGIGALFTATNRCCSSY